MNWLDGGVMIKILFNILLNNEKQVKYDKYYTCIT